MTTETTTTSSKRPTHRVYAVTKRNDRSNWDEIGAAWPHGDGKGFSVKLDYLPLNGAEISLRLIEPKAATTASEGGDK